MIRTPVSGRIGRRDQGRTEVTTARIPAMVRPIVNTSKKAGGSCSSMEPMSFENLFRIRPTGLVSKNLQGALVMLLNILSWRATEERIQRTKRLMNFESIEDTWQIS